MAQALPDVRSGGEIGYVFQTRAITGMRYAGPLADKALGGDISAIKESCDRRDDHERRVTIGQARVAY
jgi:hypothetical protein